MKFWFNRNPGLALPIIALQYHEIKLKLSLRGMPGLYIGDDSTNNLTAVAPEVSLYANYYFLDVEERRRFVQVEHEYLIEQVQYQSSDLENNINLQFNHPVKELIWVIQHNTCNVENTSADFTSNDTKVDISQNVANSVAQQSNDHFNYQSCQANSKTEIILNQTDLNAFDNAKLVLNGQDRITEQKATYFRLMTTRQAGHRIGNKHIYCYSFAINPEDHQPSGTCNFTRIDTAALKFNSTCTVTDMSVAVYAVNYNILRVMNGMGGLAYAN